METPRPPHVRHLGRLVFLFACRFIGSAALAAATPPGDVGVEFADITKPKHTEAHPIQTQPNPKETKALLMNSCAHA